MKSWMNDMMFRLSACAFHSISPQSAALCISAERMITSKQILAPKCSNLFPCSSWCSNSVMLLSFYLKICVLVQVANFLKLSFLRGLYSGGRGCLARVSINRYRNQSTATEGIGYYCRIYRGLVIFLGYFELEINWIE